MQKFLLPLILLAFLVPASGNALSPTREMRACKQSEDCKLIENDCHACHCYYEAINGNQKDTFEKALKADCALKMSKEKDEVYSGWGPCGECHPPKAEAKCVQGLCEMALIDTSPKRTQQEILRAAEKALLSQGIHMRGFRRPDVKWSDEDRNWAVIYTQNGTAQIDPKLKGADTVILEISESNLDRVRLRTFNVEPSTK